MPSLSELNPLNARGENVPRHRRLKNYPLYRTGVDDRFGIFPAVAKVKGVFAECVSAECVAVKGGHYGFPLNLSAVTPVPISGVSFMCVTFTFQIDTPLLFHTVSLSSAVPTPGLLAGS